MFIRPVRTPHKWHKCNCGDCYFCRSELTCCDVCGGFEGTLTTDCCGRQLTKEEENQVYNLGNLDFRNGQWVEKPNFTRFEGNILICVDGIHRTREEFREWCKQTTKMDESKVTDVQLAELLESRDAGNHQTENN